MRLSLLILTLLTAVVSAKKFTISLLDTATGKEEQLSETLILNPDLVNGPTIVSSLNKALSMSKAPNSFVVSLVGEEGERFDSTLFLAAKQKAYSVVFEVTLADDLEHIASISTLLGSELTNPAQIVYKKPVNLDFQSFDPLTNKPSAAPYGHPHAQAKASNQQTYQQGQAQSQYTAQGSQVPPPPPVVEEEQSFFKRYFWWIVIGGMIVFNLMSMDTGKLKEAYTQAQQQAQAQAGQRGNAQARRQ